MTSLLTVLFATDGSACAERARPVAERLAREHGADLHVLRVELVPVLEQVSFRAGPTLEPVEVTEADVAADLHLPPPPAAPGGRTVESLRRWPHVGEAVLSYAAEVGASLVVMGTHGRSGFNRLAMGSTAEYVLRRSVCPVLTVGEEARTDVGGPVLCPIDLSARARPTLAAAAGVARAAGARLHVLHVVEPLSMPSPYGNLVPEIENRDVLERSRAEIDRIVAESGVDPATTTVDVHSGHPKLEVVSVARSLGAGMVVQSSHGRTGAGRLFLGSVAETVVREAPCPVLTLRGSGAALDRPDADVPENALGSS